MGSLVPRMVSCCFPLATLVGGYLVRLGFKVPCENIHSFKRCKALCWELQRTESGGSYRGFHGADDVERSSVMFGENPIFGSRRF